MLADVKVDDLPVSQNLRQLAQAILEYEQTDPEVHM